LIAQQKVFWMHRATGWKLGTYGVFCWIIFLVFVFGVGLIYGGAKYGYGVVVVFYSANMSGSVDCRG